MANNYDSLETPGGGNVNGGFFRLFDPCVPVSPPTPPADGVDMWSSGLSMTPQLIRGVGVRGTVFSVQFQSDETGTPWTVHRLVNHMRSRRNPSVTRTEVAG